VDPIVGEIDENAKINRIDSELNLKIQELNELAMRLWLIYLAATKVTLCIAP